LQYCEVFNNTNYTKDRTPGIPFPQWTRLCQPLASLAVVADTFLVGPTTPRGEPLRASFTWHGFQHVIVSVSDTVTFDAKPESVAAKWTAMNAEATGSISFGGGKASALLNQIVAMVQAGQLSNMAAFVPTDCPTREKHAWLGDGLDVAEEAMYNFASAPMYELFLDTIRIEQDKETGNLPVNVPSGVPKKPMDISWYHGTCIVCM
jgi:alpha-L-rhamnosidase